MISTLLSVLFAIHCAAFTWLYFKRRKLRYLFLIFTFVLLSSAYLMVAVNWRPVANLFVIEIDMPLLMRILAVFTSLFAIMLYLKDRKQQAN